MSSSLKFCPRSRKNARALSGVPLLLEEGLFSFEIFFISAWIGASSASAIGVSSAMS
jgi:hypothetical protein